MITTDIKSGIDVVQDSLKWAQTFGKDSFPRDVFKNYRRHMKTIADALSENCSAAAYGESQVGKSYLMSSLLSSPNAPFLIENQGKYYNFIDDINPSGGKVSKNESTGVVTRFTLRKGNERMKDYVKVKNLSVVDIILLLIDSYYNDIKINPKSILRYEAINNAISASLDSWVNNDYCQCYITEDDVKNINDYVRDIIGNNAINVFQSDFCKEIAPIIEHIDPEKWVEVFGLLWNNNPEFNELFGTLLFEYKKLDFRTDVYLPFSAVLRSKGTMLKIDWLNTVFGNRIELEDGETSTTDIYAPDGSEIVHEFSKGILSALIGEISFTLPESIADDRKFLKKIDLLDFPGARSREKFKEGDLRDNLPMVLRRGKVAYLFNKYSRNKMISAVLFCHHNDQKGDATIGNSICNWIDNEIGRTSEERAAQLNLTNGISPLFMICTKFNIDLVKTKSDAKNCSLEAHWDRFKKTIPELINQEKWFEDWVPQSGRYASKYFQNVFLLRDFYWSSKELFEGFSDSPKTPSPETGVRISPDYPDYLDDLKASFLENPFVKKHFENAEQAWKDVATINNDGSKAIISKLDAIADVLDNARHTRYLNQLAEMRRDMVNRLCVYYESEDKEANNRKVRQISGDIKLQLAALIGTRPEAFGQIIDSLMIKSSELRAITYDIIVRHIDEPKDVSFIKLVRAECEIDVNDSKETNIQKLSKKYSKDSKELEDFFKSQGFTLDEVVKDDSEIPATMADVIANHLIDYWNRHINDQVKSLEGILPHADEVAFMLMALLNRLGVKKSLSDKINVYYKIFDVEALPNAIADYSSLTLNNFVSTIGRDYMTDKDMATVKDKATACALDIDLSIDGSAPSAQERPLLDVLSALDQSRDLINQTEIDMKTLRKLPFWDNYQRWENFVTIGLLYSSDISHVDPVANAGVKDLIDRSSTLFNA